MAGHHLFTGLYFRFKRNEACVLFALLVLMVIVEMVLVPSILLHPTLQDYATRILIVRLFTGIVGLAGFFYFAWQRDFRFMPVPLLTLLLSIGLQADQSIASALLKLGVMGQGGFHEYVFFVFLGSMVALLCWAAVTSTRQMKPAGQASPASDSVSVYLTKAGGKQIELTFNRGDITQLAQAKARIMDFLEQP